MRLAYLVLVVAAALSSIGDAASAAETSVGHPSKPLSKGNARSLRNHEKTEMDSKVDEERNWFGLFADKKLAMMVEDEDFRNEMYKVWDTKTVGEIAANLRVDKYNRRWADLLFDYLNGHLNDIAEPVRKGPRVKRVRFSDEEEAKLKKLEEENEKN